MGPSVIVTSSKELDLREQHGLLLKSSSGIMPDACVVFGCSRTAKHINRVQSSLNVRSFGVKKETGHFEVAREAGAVYRRIAPWDYFEGKI